MARPYVGLRREGWGWTALMAGVLAAATYANASARLTGVTWGAEDLSAAIGDLKAQIRKSKALEWLVRQVTYVDPEGRAIGTDTLLDAGVDIDATLDTGASVTIDAESNTSEEATSTVKDTPDELARYELFELLRS